MTWLFVTRGNFVYIGWIERKKRLRSWKSLKLFAKTRLASLVLLTFLLFPFSSSRLRLAYLQQKWPALLLSPSLLYFADLVARSSLTSTPRSCLLHRTVFRTIRQFALYIPFPLSRVVYVFLARTRKKLCQSLSSSGRGHEKSCTSIKHHPRELSQDGLSDIYTILCVYPCVVVEEGSNQISKRGSCVSFARTSILVAYILWMFFSPSLSLALSLFFLHCFSIILHVPGLH